MSFQWPIAVEQEVNVDIGSDRELVVVERTSVGPPGSGDGCPAWTTCWETRVPAAFDQVGGTAPEVPGLEPLCRGLPNSSFDL